MITEREIAAKSDAELLAIWREQIDYRDEVVFWVGMELSRRGIRAEDVPVMTVLDQVERDNIYDAKVTAIPGMIKWTVAGLMLLFTGLGSAWETIHNRRNGEELFSLGSVLGGIFVLWIAHGKWKRGLGN